MKLHKLITKARLIRHGLSPHMRVFSHTSVDERLALFAWARALPPGARVLEIGSHIGSSALFICAGLSHGGGQLLCVDTWMNETMPDGAKDTFAEFTGNTRQYAGMITPIRKYSTKLTPEEIGGLLDLAFIDGDHSESTVREDFVIVAPWVKPGGLIAFHDASCNYPGVNVVLGEALASRNWELAGFTQSLAVIRHIAR